MGLVRERMESKLRQAFAPAHLEVIDETNKHHGHAGWRESGETHFHVSIISASFSGKTRLERQRMIYQVLTEEMTGSVHALAIAARAPEEN